jgi:hypothetical protein
MGDRRDTRRRSEVLKRVVEWLGRQRSPVEGAPDDVVGTTAARILAMLAIRGLARHESQGWIPTRALISPAELIPER